jgi:hypothetical protein
VTTQKDGAVSNRIAIKAVCPSSWSIGGMNPWTQLNCPLGEYGFTSDSILNHLQVVGIDDPGTQKSIQFSYQDASNSALEKLQPVACTMLKGLTINGNSLQFNWRAFPLSGSSEMDSVRVCALTSISERMVQSPEEKTVYWRSFEKLPRWNREETGKGLPLGQIPTYRQVRHYAWSGTSCQTYARDRWALGWPGGTNQTSMLSTPVAYHDGEDIPTFVMDPLFLKLTPVSGLLTRWANQCDPSDIHRSPFGLKGGGGTVSKGSGGSKASSGDRGGWHDAGASDGSRGNYTARSARLAR